MKKFEYDYLDISRSSERSLTSVRADVSRGVVVPEDLKSVGVYIALNLLRCEVLEPRVVKTNKDEEVSDAVE